MKKMFFVVICAMMFSMALISCGNGAATVATTDVDSTAVDTVLVDSFAVDSVLGADTVAIDSVIAE